MPRRSIFGEVKDTNKRGQCQIYSNIAERKYLRQAKDTKSRKQCKLICFLPRRNILGAAKVRSPFVSPRPAEDASAACGGTMQPSAWGGCGLPLFGCDRRARLSKLYFAWRSLRCAAHKQDDLFPQDTGLRIGLSYLRTEDCGARILRASARGGFGPRGAKAPPW